MELLDDEALSRTSVVANNAMNRERQLDGPNSYKRELGFHPLDWLQVRRAERGAPVAWLDVCCGTGRALVQAAPLLAPGDSIIGLDLVDYFDPADSAALTFVCDSVATWQPPRRFDLITCVHGLHYVGDKLAALARIAGWLNEGGRLVADLDLASIRTREGSPAGRTVAAALWRAGFEYDARRHRIQRTGPAEVAMPFTYLGADAQAGPNYTKQPAVNSYYLLGAEHV